MANQQWDIFCKVIDNFGDIGVCWRLASDLATRGQRVRLWVDDASALTWLAPADCLGVEVLPWHDLLDTACLETTPCDVLVETFGCEIAPEFIAACHRIYSARAINGYQKPLWINLEYLSAESYVAKNHGLTNLVNSGPAAGWRKVFYYPGFTPDTGGLLREPDLFSRQAAFDRAAWLDQQGIGWHGETLVSLFCYEPAALASWMGEWAQNGICGQAVNLLVAAGRATQAVKAIEASKKLQNNPFITLKPNESRCNKLSISYLPLLCQSEFDHLLWACNINFVRGEDSMVRAIWAGKPFIWQIYPQDDGAHGPKLAAFLDRLAAPAALRAFHAVWNGLANHELPALPDLPGWMQFADSRRARLAELTDLTTGLIKYAAKNR